MFTIETTSSLVKIGLGVVDLVPPLVDSPFGAAGGDDDFNGASSSTSGAAVSLDSVLRKFPSFFCVWLFKE